MNPEIEKIKEIILSKMDEQISFMKSKFNEESSLLEFELQLKKDSNEYARILFEKLFPHIFGDGYFGSKVTEINKETKKEETYSCVIRNHPRTLKSIFGHVKITRAYYQHDQSGSSIGLLDKKLDFHGRTVTPGVRYYANLLGITTSYREGEDLYKKWTGIPVSAKDIDNFTEEKASEITEHFEERIQNISLDSNNKISPAKINAKEESKRIIYFETDGCFVPIRKRRTEDGDWKECKSLLLFELEEKEVQKGAKKEKKQVVVNKKHFSTVSGVNYLKKQVKCELESYCGKDPVKIVCIGDGASWIWRMVGELIPTGRVEILDWFHVKEKITLLAAELFPNDKQANDKEMFVDSMKSYLFNGQVEKGIEYLREMYAKTKSRKLQGRIYETIGYFENNKDKMNYPEYKKNGFCIGSGAIESANKNVIQRRMKLPGCRWTEEHADNIAHMRAEYMNGKIDEWFGMKNNPMLASVT